MNSYKTKNMWHRIISFTAKRKDQEIKPSHQSKNKIQQGKRQLLQLQPQGFLMQFLGSKGLVVPHSSSPATGTTYNFSLRFSTAPLHICNPPVGPWPWHLQNTKASSTAKAWPSQLWVMAPGQLFSWTRILSHIAQPHLFTMTFSILHPPHLQNKYHLDDVSKFCCWLNM